MTLRQELESIRTGDQKRLEDIKKQIELLVQERAELEKTIDSAVTLLSRKFGVSFNEGNKTEVPKEEPKSESIPKKFPFRYKSTQDAAFEIIFEDGNKPTHIKDIYQRIIEGGKKLKNRSSVGVSLRRDPRFIKVGPNVFAITDEEYRKAKEGTK